MLMWAVWIFSHLSCLFYNNCLVGAGALVTENKEFPDGSLIVGSPAKAVRELSQEMIENMTRSSKHYVANFKKFKEEMVLIK